MKKTLVVSILLIILWISWVSQKYIFANNLSIAEEEKLNTIQKKLEKIIPEYPWIQDKLTQRISKILQNSSQNSQQTYFLQALLDVVESIEIPEPKAIYYDIDYKQYFVDGEILKQSWLWLYNTHRNNYNLPNYIYDDRLEQTALEWSAISLDRWYISHERTLWDGWYNYPIIEQWFQDRWVTCAPTGRTTSVENTWYHAYYCPDGGDCTQKASDAMKQIFDIYAAEKWLPYPNNAHYKTIVSPHLQYLWLWLSFKDEWNGWIQMYVTTHFCTEFS